MRVHIRPTIVGVMCLILLSACASEVLQAADVPSRESAPPTSSRYTFIEFYSPL